MATDTPTRQTVRPAPVGGWALIVGGIAFAVFWVLAPTRVNDELPWVAGLTVHGVSIVSLIIGIALLAMSTLRSPSGTIIGVGAIVAIIGLLTVFPLIPAGLAIVAWGLRRDGWPAAPTTALLTGSLALFALAIARYIAVGAALAGQEGAPSLTTPWTIGYIASIMLMSVGMVLLGLLRRRGSR